MLPWGLWSGLWGMRYAVAPPWHPVLITTPQDCLLPVWGFKAACLMEDRQGH